MLRHAICRGFVLVMFFSAMGIAWAEPPLPSPADLPQQAEMPNALEMRDGTAITTADGWHTKRVPELKQLFSYYMYGEAPPPPKRVSAKVERINGKLFNGKATKREITISFPPEGCPPIHLLLVTPNNVSGRAPVFVGLNFCGNHTLLDDPTVALPTGWVRNNRGESKNNRATEQGRGSRIDVWAIEQTIDHGYAVATFYSGDVDPDKPDFSDGVHPHFYKQGQTRPGPHEWGTIAAWAWGIQRVVDYLITNDAIDSDRIAVVGHSRNGKTALLAGALDERIDLIIPHQAGCGGTSPSRSPVGEQLHQINRNFPHWFCDTFKEFNDQVDRLPIDQNCLIAMCAPRPVLLSNAQGDQWADPAGQFRALRAADPVYRLLGVGGVAASEMPPHGKLLGSRLGYYIREGKHSMRPDDWRVFLAFANKHFGKPK